MMAKKPQKGGKNGKAVSKSGFLSQQFNHIQKVCHAHSLNLFVLFFTKKACIYQIFISDGVRYVNGASYYIAWRDVRYYYTRT
jgi:penicillin-binding protein-related factor A (putative recombinase)